MAITNTNIIKYLDIELQAKITEVLDKTEAKDILDASLITLNEDVQRLSSALSSLRGEPKEATPSPVLDPREVPAVHKHVEPAVVKAAPTQPVCPSCGGSMYYQARTLGSGRVIQLWVCSECSNERM